MNEASSPHRRLNVGSVLAGKYKLIEKIGAGSFGMVFKTQNLKSGEFVAAKFEKREDGQRGVSLLTREIKVLSEVNGIKGFPQLKFYGRDDHYNFFMETYLGMNLEQLMRKCGGKFTLNTVLMIGVQLLERLKAFHEKNLIHRDIKPENFTIARHDVAQIYAIDFGLAKYYRDQSGKHIGFISNKGLIGTARYASISALQGNEQSRRDDIEALGYVLIYFLLGELPWQNIQVNSKEEKYQAILKLKQDNVIDHLKVPDSLIQLVKNAQGLEFVQEPDYGKYIQLMQNELVQGNNKFDWELLLEQQESIKDRMSVSIDLVDNDFDNQNEQQLQVANSMQKIQHQDPKFIQGRLNNNGTYLEVPKCSIIMDSHNNTLLSINTSKVNHYQKSFNVPSSKQFSDLRVNSCDQLVGDDEDFIPSQDDKPSLSYQNLVILRRASSKQ